MFLLVPANKRTRCGFIWDIEERRGGRRGGGTRGGTGNAGRVVGLRERGTEEKGCGSRCGVLFTVLVELAEARRAQKI